MQSVGSNLRNMGRRWTYLWRSVVALLALWLVGMKAAQQVKWIGPDPTLEFTLVVGAGVLVFADNVQAIYQTYRQPKADRLRRKMDLSLLACIRSLGEEPHVGVDPWGLGTSVYVYRKKWRIFDATRMVRIRPFRLTDDPQESIISWTDKKGVVGKAGREKLPQHADWTKQAPNWNADRSKAVALYKALSDEDRWGFSFEEFNQVACKYVEALAVPIMNRDGTKVLGVLGLDVPFRPHASGYVCALNTHEAERIATTCAKSLREALDSES